MKGFMSSFIVLLIFISVLSLAFVLSSKNLESGEIVSKNFILDRVYSKFDSIDFAIRRILQEEASLGGINITIEENSFNIVTFQEVLPRRNASDFGDDLDRFERFAEMKMNETNLALDLNFTSLRCLPLVISPYNILYMHFPDGSECQKVSAQTEVKIYPSSALTYLNSYNSTFKLLSANRTGDPSFSDKCSGGTFPWTITIISANGSTYGPITKMVQTNKRCNMEVPTTCNPSHIKVTLRENPEEEKEMTINVQPPETCNNVTSTVSLNLTDIPGRVNVGFSPQSIKVKETLYQIEKNDTIYVY